LPSRFKSPIKPWRVDFPSITILFTAISPPVGSSDVLPPAIVVVDVAIILTVTLFAPLHSSGSLTLLI